ncbi:MAG TPA: HAD family phosphatase [Terriglobales bacterium]|jgi:putative hydrolase of the HAD superfamily|nr:HAD family phosphatase [Terriglobales bacterium]
MADGLPKIHAVIFDYGEVLCYPPHSEEIARMADIFRVEPKSFPALWQKNRPGYDLGDYTPATYWEMLASDAKVKVTPEQLAALSDLDSEMWGHENPRMVEWVHRIAAAGIKTALLSNMHPEMVSYIRKKFAWLNNFKPAIFSADVRMVKPDPAIYRHTLKELGVAAENTMFIDDREVNIKAARALGIHAIQMKSMAQLVEDVKALGFPVLPVFGAGDELAAAAIKM